MRIAFASCMCTRVFKQQPVWDWIAAQKPDHLVLLGDSIYLDVAQGGPHPQMIGENEFAQELFALYTELLAQPSFAGLVRGLPAGRVWSIWDDHDFLWNDAVGADAAANPVQRVKVRLSTAFQEAFRATLSKSMAPGSFPAAYNDAAFWNMNQPPLTTPSVALAPDLWLHLSDDRTYRTRTWLIEEAKCTVFGAAQRKQIGAAVLGAPQAVHLFASGSVVADYKKRYARDWQWLNDLAAKERMLVLSGDIHRNETDAFFTGGLPLHEATSSGAAVKDAVEVGKTRRNYGLLDIDADTVKIRVFADNAEETKWTRTIDRASWLPR